MAGRNNPPFPLRKADFQSKFVATGLVMAFPMLEGSGSILHNYGSWGDAANLTISNASWTKRETGLSSLAYKAPSAVAKNTTMSQTIPENWSWATWIKLDSTPSITPHELFSFRASNGDAQVRAWGDNVGLWSWQKASINEDYSVLYPAALPLSGPALLVSTYAGSNLAPVQLITDTGMRHLPQQPTLYSTFNVGRGDVANTLDTFYLGNNDTNSAIWDGVIGPFYFWDRVITDSEIWELWQDPYAPFRRQTMEWFAPSALRTTSGFFYTGLGKTTGPKTIIQDQNSLFILVDDDYFYMNLPIDEAILPGNETLFVEINDDYDYSALPSESVPTPELITLIISVEDEYSYITHIQDTTPDYEKKDPPVITASDDFYYVSFLQEDVTTVVPQGPLTIEPADEYSYIANPGETVTTS